MGDDAEAENTVDLSDLYAKHWQEGHDGADHRTKPKLVLVHPSRLLPGRLEVWCGDCDAVVVRVVVE